VGFLFYLCPALFFKERARQEALIACGAGFLPFYLPGRRLLSLVNF